MLDGLLSQPGMVALQSRLELLSAQRGAIADNLANVDTPGYKPIVARYASAPGGFGASFATALASAGGSGGGGAAGAPGSIVFVRETGVTMRADGNGVGVDSEMARLARTQLWYASDARVLQMDFQRLLVAVRGG